MLQDIKPYQVALCARWRRNVAGGIDGESAGGSFKVIKQKDGDVLEDDDYDDVDCFHSISKKVIEKCKRKCSEEDYTAFVVYDDEVFFTNKDAAKLEEAADGGRRIRDATLYIRVDSEGAQSEGDAGGAAGEDPETSPPFGETLLHMAAFTGHAALVDQLLAAGARASRLGRLFGMFCTPRGSSGGPAGAVPKAHRQWR